jgi:monoamine oxidase
MADVIVIGAGMAGATAARALARAGFAVSVLEGTQRLGGRVYTLRDFCGAPVEAGAEFIHGVGAETWADARAAGLTVRPSPHTRDTMFNIGHGAHWLPRVVLHPGVWPTYTILRRLARMQPPDMSARQFIERRGYRGRARTLAQMVLTAHLPGSIDEVGVLGLLEDGVLKLETGLNHRINEGYDRLVAHIGGGLDIEYGFVAHTIEWSPAGVTVRSTDGRERSARTAVSTLPVGVLQSGTVRFIPELPEGKRSALQSMVMGPVLKILLRFEERFWPQGLSTLGCGVGPVTLYWNVFYRASDTQPVLTAYCTGPRAAALSQVSEEDAAAIAVKDLRTHFPKATPKLVAYHRIDWSTDRMALGGYTFLRPGGTGARGRLAASDTGALFWAGSATATRTIAATVEGAFVSGLRAASEAGAVLERRRTATAPVTDTRST